MTDLLPLAVTAEPLLRAIAAEAGQSNAALAAASGRSDKNLPRDLKSLEAAGLVALKPTEITGGGLEQLAMLDRARESGAAQPAPASDATGIAGLLHAQIRVGDRNPRRDWDSPDAIEALQELADSIQAEDDGRGLVLQNLIVRPLGPIEDWNTSGPNGETLPVYELVAGERRLRAVGRLIEAGTWPRDKPLPALVRKLDEAGHDRVALIENLKRRDLKPLEEARAFRRLIDGGMKTAELAEIINTSQRLVQQRLQLLELDDKDQKRLEKGEMTIEQARSKIANRKVWPDLPKFIHLALAEIADKLVRAPKSNDSGKTEIDPAADVTPFNEWVGYPNYLFDFTAQDYDDGRAYARLSYHAKDYLRHFRLPFGADDEWHAAFHALRVETLGADIADRLAEAGAYYTPFLNGPWDVTAEAQAKLAEREADNKARAALTREHQAAVLERRQLVLSRVEAVEKSVAPGERPDGAGFSEALAAADSPLPWYFHQENYNPAEIIDAAGGIVIRGGCYLQYEGSAAEHARMRMMVLAANSAAGLAAPAEKPIPIDEEDDQDGDGEFDEDFSDIEADESEDA